MSGFLLLAFTTAPHKVALVYPSYFPPLQYNLDENRLTKEKIELGRVLFYDPILSVNNQISCASCHSPYNAFAHTDHNVSHGIFDSLGNRNAPALFNLAWQKSFMWDGAIHHLDMQALAPISHPREMGESLENVINKLKKKELYLKLFSDAYGDTTISGERFLKALSAFELTLISANSKYDHVKQGKDTFNVQEKNGYRLFTQFCNSCHTEPLFTNYSFKNNGLPIDTSYHDSGRYLISRKKEDSLCFKVPSLRNLSYSYPYMHDGRFKNLSAVLNHYTKMEKSPILAEELEKPILLSENEKVDLIAFLLCLNDKSYLLNEGFHFPQELLKKTIKE